MILRDRCSISYDLASLLRGRGSTLDRWNGKIAKRTGTRPSAVHNFTFFKEVLQNCFVFNAVNLENWGSLAELLRFWRCQVGKFWTSRRLAAFSMLSRSKTEEVSQNSFVSSLQIDRSIDRQLQLQLPLPRHYYYSYNYKYKCRYTTLHATTLITLHYATLH